MEKQQNSAPVEFTEEVVLAACQHQEVLLRVGQLTRNLHDSLRGLGLDTMIQKTAHEIPNVRDRLNYVAQMSEQAAQRVLNATEAAIPLQDKVEKSADHLAEEWKGIMAASFSEADYRAMAVKTMVHLDEMRNVTNETKQYLMEIMMAQDFQDLTGQVITKITELAHNVEQQLIQLLVDHAPQEMRRDAGSGLLNGPQINPDEITEVVSDQSQVDDLLDSLGF